MGKKVVVIASGETEKRSLPSLLAHLEEEKIKVIDIRYPPQHRDLTVKTVEPLVKAVWFASLPDERPDKFVVLKDVDGKQPGEVLGPLRQEIPRRLRHLIKVPIQFAYAQWHLEAWFFGDSTNLRSYLGRDLGRVDTSKPDEIQNPKLHLKNLLRDTTYTSATSEEIAVQLNALSIAERSPSFRNFLGEVKNGDALGDPTCGWICRKNLR